MNFKILIKAALLVSFTCSIMNVTVHAQDYGLGPLSEIPDHGEIRGIVSFYHSYLDERRTFLGVWYFVKQSKQEPNWKNLLVVFERKENKYHEMFRNDDSAGGGTWERLLPLPPSQLTGLIISASEISGDDDQWLIALVNGKFKTVHHSTGTSEFLDIDDDGFPEIFDSMWPDGDGYPESTTVYIWDGKAYRSLLKVKYEARLSKGVRTAVGKASRRFRSAVGR